MPTRALSRSEARELDRRAIEEWGIPSIVLMENAGRACAEVVLAAIEAGDRRPVRVFCGPGNNGGDGFVIARTCRNRGVDVELYFAPELSKLETLSSDVRTNAYLWTEMGGVVNEVASGEAVEALSTPLAESSVLVDALFGTGLTRPLEGLFGELVEALNAARRPIVAVDVPSGLDADDGRVLGTAIRATETVTFVAPKLGCHAGRGPELCGRMTVAEIGVPTAWL